MKPPVDHVRISTRSKEILIKIKRHTGLEQWNDICRIALCRSLANQTQPPKLDKLGDSAIDIEWKTFAGAVDAELAALTLFRAHKDGIDISKKDLLANYFRSHLERGIASMQNVKSLALLCKLEE